MQVWSLGWKDSLEKGMSTYSSVLAWRIPWTEEPGGLYSPWGHKEPHMTEWLSTHRAATYEGSSCSISSPTLIMMASIFFKLKYNWFIICVSFRYRSVGHLFYVFSSVQFSRSVMSDSATPWIAACQASLSITNSRSSLRLNFIESVMPSSHLILCRPLLLLPPIPPSIRIFSKESTLRMRWPKYWSFSFSIIPSKEIQGLISFRMDWLDLSVQGTQESSPTPQFKSINSSVLSFLHSPALTSIHDYRKNHSFD